MTAPTPNPTPFCEAWIERKLRERLSAYQRRYPTFKIQRLMDYVATWDYSAQRWAPYMTDKDIKSLNRLHHRSQSLKSLGRNEHL